MFKDNKDFYPTPKSLIRKMVSKIDFKKTVNCVLEPSAGKGDIIDYIKTCRQRWNCNIKVIEKDPILRKNLMGERKVEIEDAYYESSTYKVNVIDTDFLSYCGPDKFNLIIMNPPFSNGIDHLNKAIDIMYNGQIVCLLNASNLKNPSNHKRELLLKRLENLNADIEYHTGAFSESDSERKTNVEVALIYISIENDIESDIIKQMDKAKNPNLENIEETFDISKKDDIHGMVKDFQRMQEAGIKTVGDYYKNHKLHGYFSLGVAGGDNNDFNGADTMTDCMSIKVNQFLNELRQDYWRKILSFKAISERLTSKKAAEVRQMLQENIALDFTEANIKILIKELVLSYDDTLTKAVLEVFDEMTIRYAHSPHLHTKTVHYFDGWKTNQAYMVNKKVIIPTWSNTFEWDKWRIPYRVEGLIDDIDKVMNYFDPNPEYVSMRVACEKAFLSDQSKKIESTYFIIDIYKKGTIHLTFRSEDTRRKFNITACKGRGWLPHDYSNKSYDDMASDEKKVVKSFESVKIYEENVNLTSKTLFSPKSMLRIA